MKETSAEEAAIPLAYAEKVVIVPGYGLAVAQARGGSRKRALAALEKAVAAGFADAGELEADEAFAPLRQEAGFRRLVEGIRSPR